MTSKNILTALAGQPNCGKSTVFNMLTGARQFVANYPGVTVEKKTGFFSLNGSRAELVDLPGTYSLTSYSLEERVARDFLLGSKPSVTVNVVDASNLKRNLYLTFQLLEMGVPTVLALNMMDVARRRGFSFDIEGLSKSLGVPVVPTTAKKNEGGQEIKSAVRTVAKGEAPQRPLQIDYEAMEPDIRHLAKVLDAVTTLDVPLRWLCVKLMENDELARILVAKGLPDGKAILADVDERRRLFEQEHGQPPEQFIAFQRHIAATRIASTAVSKACQGACTITDRIDRVVCHRYLGPLILVGVLYVLYHLSIVQGYELTNYTWPLLASLHDLVASILPDQGFIQDPLLRSLGLWFMDSVNALLNYIPIFFILFSLIAVIEDSGYMPRIAFLLDRLLRRFGLHGQSTLPLILGGVYVGGCAIPGVMACRAIPDERSRMATILIVPLMNCLAKVPLYVLLVGAYFAEFKGLAMFFIATVTIFIALPVAKVLSATVLKQRESAPFIMEMPPYHMPTVVGVLRRAIERVWLFLRKIVTIVAAVAVIIFVLMQFPGVSEEKMAKFQARGARAVAAFQEAAAGTEFKAAVAGERWLDLIRFAEGYKSSRLGVTDQDKANAIDERFEAQNPAFYAMVKGSSGDAKAMKKALRTFERERNAIRREIKNERLDASFLGTIGQALVPVTQYAGFNWRVNVSLLSAFAAKESTISTLGALYEQEASTENKPLEKRMVEVESGFTPLHALALMLFMALYPPCIATTIMVKIQSGEIKWMLFAVGYPMVLGLGFSTLVFTGGTALGLNGLQAMGAFYALALAGTVAAALWNPNNASQED